MKRIQSILFTTLLFASVAFAQPKSVELVYEVSRNGSAFGDVTESYQQTGQEYQIVSTTKGEGIYALLGKRVLKSHGAVTEQGLKPKQFTLDRGDNKRKSLRATFDWAANQLSMLVKGKTITAQLEAGAQDLVSYAYQFMFTPPKGDQVKVWLTTGKKLKQYTYNVKARDVEIKTSQGTFKTLHLVDAEVDGKKRKELWLAPSKHYLPVKYLVVDKHGDQIEQVLTSMRIK